MSWALKSGPDQLGGDHLPWPAQAVEIKQPNAACWSSNCLSIPNITRVGGMRAFTAINCYQVGTSEPDMAEVLEWYN